MKKSNSLRDVEVNQKIQKMIEKKESKLKIISFVKKNKLVNLKPKTLGMLFELIEDLNPTDEDLTSYFCNEVLIEDLKQIHPGFESTNGCQWARSDTSYLGKKYKVKRKIEKNKVISVKLDGPNNNSVKRYRCIRQDIKDNITAQRCAILDTSSNIEVDHKNGRYDELSNMDTTTQKESEFQPLNKVCNDAKREHCKRCREIKKRYDARRLGYSHGWTVGDEDTDSCIGCYWYDIKAFNKKISSNY